MENPMITQGEKDWNADPYYKEDRYDQDRELDEIIDSPKEMTIDQLFSNPQWHNVLKAEKLSYDAVLEKNSKQIRGDASKYTQEWNMRLAARKDPAMDYSTIFITRKLNERKNTGMVRTN